ncbi:collagen triple helix repeat-containing protein 1-like [Lingula anatina]|uniref:Collagen triple helix repeat-containing protein 1-like n=1 Tax=Lingula anatina TaxID=7574 RepID=A0A1S3HMD4_LINAN|nr:collagen triple helix repeat-containing protein 1-like [Lingula anatina]|eukprot:XP_013387245.1 collagen triple helix repeat-containing protein 1-like [Lingula anatina]
MKYSTTVIFVVLATFSISQLATDAQQCYQNGKDGKDGTDGRDGRDGRDGLWGETGPPGPKGEAGTPCSPRNVKQFTWTDINDDRDVGLIKDVWFTKTTGTTMLRVGFHGNVRIMATAGKNEACRRYWFTFNGTECDSPTFIDGQFYSSHTYNVHQHSTIEGICENLAAGEVVIGFHVGQCRNRASETANAYTGWASATRIIVEEI